MSYQRIIKNKKAFLSVDLFGGALVDFRLWDHAVNPLCFKFTREQMPEQNKAGAPYQGHFVCLGRWGEPSAGEIRAGIPSHGHLANILWEEDASDNEHALIMTATSQLEGLNVKRIIQMDGDSPVVAVEEVVHNIRPLGRLFNIVQHPTLSAPFLENATIVDCNAGIGFNQAFSNNPYPYALQWPMGHFPGSAPVNLRSPFQACNGVFSFIVDKNSKHGWITAYSPQHQMVLGYVWNRNDYPWIHLWQDWMGDSMRYRGLEFGTAGYHLPFNQILQRPLQLFEEDTCGYIDADEKVSKRFLSFIFKVEEGYTSVASVQVVNGKVIVEGRQGSKQIFPTAFTNF